MQSPQKGSVIGQTALIAGTIGGVAMINRPADTTAYTALDVVGDTSGALLTFIGAARVVGGAGYIMKARLMTDQSTCTARFRLHLYHTAPSPVPADNAQYGLLFADAAKRIGSIDFAATATEGTGSSLAASSVNSTIMLGYVCVLADPADANIYGVLETLDAFTPASGQKFYVELLLEQS